MKSFFEGIELMDEEDKQEEENNEYLEAKKKKEVEESIVFGVLSCLENFICQMKADDNTKVDAKTSNFVNSLKKKYLGFSNKDIGIGNLMKEIIFIATYHYQYWVKLKA